MKLLKKLLPLVLILALLVTFGQEIPGLLRTVTYHLAEHTEAECRVYTYAITHGLSYGDYPESLVELLERNPETADFVLEYPLWEGGDYDLSEYEDLETVPLFLQWDQRWGYEIYGSDMIAITGCGPTCLAMVGYYLTGDDWYTPENLADYAEENGYYSPGKGTSWTLISQGAVDLGFDVTEIPLAEKRIRDNLEVGNPIILSVGPGDFTTTGHYIVLTAVEEGLLRVNDPNSPANSEKLWTYEELAPQIRNLWVIRKF